MFICLDIETTGLNAKDDHVIEVAIVLFDHDKIIDEWSSLVKPSISIPEFTTRLTGITNEMVKDAPKLEEIIDTINEKIGDYPVIGHFIFFDLNFLNHHGFKLENQQLDTCQLTQALLPNEPSYSLEVLVQKMKLNQPDAHRALDDVKANIELFWKLRDHLKALKHKDEIIPILKKSTWPWAEYVLDIIPNDGGELIERSTSEKKIHSEEHANLTDLTSDLDSPFLFEEKSYTYQDLLNYSLKLEDKTLLAIPKLAQFPSHKDAGLLKHANQYIDKNRLATYLSKDSLDTIETILGIKILLWLHHTEKGEKSELKIVRDEKKEWFNICCQEVDTSDSFYQKAKNSAFEKKVVVIDHQHFLQERSRKKACIKMPENIVIGEIEQFVQSIEWAWHIQLNESRFLQNLHQLKDENPHNAELIITLANRISIFFGFIGIFMKEHGDEKSFRHSTIVETHHQNTTEWYKVIKAATSIKAAADLKENFKASSTRDEFERHLNYLIKILQTRGPILWITMNQDDQPIVHTFPENPAQLFTERVWKTKSKLHLFCHHGDISDKFAFVKKELGLPEETGFKSSEDIIPLPIITPNTKISSPKDPRNIQDVVNELKIHIPKIKGNIMILANSMKVAENFYYKLQDLVKETGRKLFVQNMGGGMGKIYKMSQKTDGNNLFVGNLGLMQFLLAEGINIKFLAIHRLPFSPPYDPIQISRTKSYNDTYKDFALPQASLRFQSILSQFLGNEWQEKQILILDPRALQNERYWY